MGNRISTPANEELSPQQIEDLWHMDRKWVDDTITLERATVYHTRKDTHRLYFRDDKDRIIGYVQYDIVPSSSSTVHIVYFIAPGKGQDNLQKFLQIAKTMGCKRVTLNARVDPKEDPKASKARILLYTRNGFVAYSSSRELETDTTIIDFQLVL